MDTDSFVISINENPLHQMKQNEDLFDLSVYPKTNEVYSAKNSGVLGTLKDEYPHNEITEFICLKSKCYAYKLKQSTEKIKNKGIPYSVSNI